MAGLISGQHPMSKTDLITITAADSVLQKTEFRSIWFALNLLKTRLWVSPAKNNVYAVDKDKLAEYPKLSLL